MVGIITCCSSDLSQESMVQDLLDELVICSEIVVIKKKHLASKNILAYLEQAHAKGIEVLIGYANVNAFLTKIILDHTHLPLICLPYKNGSYSESGKILSTSQISTAEPIDSIDIDRARNAAITAARILAPKYPYINLGLQELADREQYGDQDTKEILNVQPLSLAS